MDLLYAGVGSRRTPIEICSLMNRLAVRLNQLGWTLRSGHAQGADRSFESGAGSNKQIFLKESATPEALELASQLHPRWDLCNDVARKLHARNCYQILGVDLLSPVKFVCCYTPNGEEHEDECTIETGGTATAIRLASRYSIPIFNLQRPGRLDLLKPLIERYQIT